MPTIDALPAATAAADTDEFAVSQNGTVRKVTRAQVLAGTQPALAIPAATLLGRSAAGVGAPAAVTIGANLTLTGNTLSANAAPFIIPTLAQGSQPAATDTVAIGQAGGNYSLSFAQFMAGLGGLSGVDISHLSVTPTGASGARALADLFADALPVESFGAHGDGQTDDSAALLAALASGKPLRFGPKTYIVNGQFTIGTNAVLLGVPGQTILQRATQTGGGAWISVQGASFVADGIIFDANRAAVPTESWGVLVTAACLQTRFRACAFLNAQGPTLGNGLTIAASDPAIARHLVQSCEFSGNAAHGIWVQAVRGVEVAECLAHDNGVYGICLDYNDPTFQQKVRRGQVIGNRCWNNVRGISIGNFNATNSSPPVWGQANPDVIGVLATANFCHDNSVYGIAAAGQNIAIIGNHCADNGSAANGGAGILANVAATRIAGNMVTGTAQFGIDSGGAVDTEITQNFVACAVIGINPGGAQNILVSQNFVQDCTEWAITVQNVETDGHGQNFGLAADNISITDNWLCFGGTSGGVYVLDGAQNMLIARNNFVGRGGASVTNCLWAHTGSVIIEANRWNNTQRFICNPVASGSQQLVHFPDIADHIMITSAPSGVQSMLTERQLMVLGQIGFVGVTSGGSGYTQATIAIVGLGNGAVASAMISNGVIIGITLSNPGAGYGGIGAMATVLISGDGTGAAALAWVGLPVPEERRLGVSCNCAVTFARLGSTPFQENWTMFDLTTPANAEVEFAGTWGGWRAVQPVLGDYFSFTGDGTIALRNTGAGELQLHAGSAAKLRVCSDAEPTGVLSLIGRGSPLGVVSAPPGSEFRNLNGGAGATLWIKVTAQDATGWTAIA